MALRWDVVPEVNWEAIRQKKAEKWAANYNKTVKRVK